MKSKFALLFVVVIVALTLLVAASAVTASNDTCVVHKGSELWVNHNALPAHLGHGDKLCDPVDPPVPTPVIDPPAPLDPPADPPLPTPTPVIGDAVADPPLLQSVYLPMVYTNICTWVEQDPAICK